MFKPGPRSFFILSLFVAVSIVVQFPAAAAAPPSACPVGGYAAVACPVVNDAVIAQVVRSRFAGSIVKLPNVVQIKVSNGAVYLSGQVTSLAQKYAATILAASVRGVTCIRNDIFVRPSSDSDFAMTAAVVNILNKSTFNVSQVRVMVNNGVVTLTGMVGSDYIRSMVGGLPYSVPGVEVVYNNLDVSMT